MHALGSTLLARRQPTAAVCTVSSPLLRPKRSQAQGAAAERHAPVSGVCQGEPAELPVPHARLQPLGCPRLSPPTTTATGAAVTPLARPASLPPRSWAADAAAVQPPCSHEHAGWRQQERRAAGRSDRAAEQQGCAQGARRARAAAAAAGPVRLASPCCLPQRGCRSPLEGGKTNAVQASDWVATCSAGPVLTRPPRHGPSSNTPCRPVVPPLACASLCRGAAGSPGQRAMGGGGHALSAKETYLTHTANRHPFHVLPHSPWPLLAAGGAFVTMLGKSVRPLVTVLACAGFCCLVRRRPGPCHRSAIRRCCPRVRPSAHGHPHHTPVPPTTAPRPAPNLLPPPTRPTRTPTRAQA